MARWVEDGRGGDPRRDLTIKTLTGTELFHRERFQSFYGSGNSLDRRSYRYEKEGERLVRVASDAVVSRDMWSEMRAEQLAVQPIKLDSGSAKHVVGLLFG